jgi:RNA polymerase sigma-70 factor, ECF subfamily
MNATDTREVEPDVLVIGAGPIGVGPDGVDASPAASHPTFDEVLARHQDELYRYAAHLTRNRAEADDLYLETLLDAYRALDQFNGPANHRIWLYMLATRAFLRDGRPRGRAGPSGVERATEILGTPSKNATRLDERNLLRVVEVLVADLPLTQRVALVLRMFHDLSYAEIAVSLRCPEEAAQASVHAALRSLRDHLEDRL